MQTLALPEIAADLRRQYAEQGYFILPGALSAEELDLLRDECARGIAERDAELDRLGKDVDGLTHRNKRYFIRQSSLASARLLRFFLGERMGEIARATVGPEAYAFYEQFVVKCGEQGMKFGWHQDGGYVKSFAHCTYVTCWCALDDVSEANGTAYILPYERAGTRELVDHVREPGTNDLVGYHGSDPGIPVVGPAGTVAVFSSTTFHRSGANTTSRPRRAYVAQYAPEIIRTPDGRPLHRSEPLLRGGQRAR
ncbi:MAG: phytanoyl-CoA dioxygenase family protein [Planctomycetota bacterium]|nr:phytanoyl-CoA dioxygenase family protein [Planctomycetota bacterium]